MSVFKLQNLVGITSIPFTRVMIFIDEITLSISSKKHVHHVKKAV